jgi:hypothetical protein
MRRFSFIAAALVALCAPGIANAGLSCTVKDKSVQLTLESGVTRGMGGPFFDFKAELKTNLPNVPKDFRQVKFADDHLPQRWLNDREAKLAIYRERDGEPHGYVEIQIETKRVSKDDDGNYKGTYALTIHSVALAGKPEPKPITARGAISCMSGD